MPKWRKLIVALDIDEASRLKAAVKELGPKVDKFKIGAVAFTRWGPELVKYVVRRKKKVFLDLKFYDIPHTMIKASCAAAEMGIWAFTVHLKAGSETLSMLRRSLGRFCRQKGIKRPLIIGVSELTSDRASLAQVLRLISLAQNSRLDGVVCSAHEAGAVKSRFPRLLVITPGIRPALSDDQRRIATASFAFRQGADYIVVGRPIINHPPLLPAAEAVLES